MKGFKSYTINELDAGEGKVIVDAVVKFIAGIEQLKTLIKSL